MKNTPEHIVIFDGTSYFVESFDYEQQEEEKIIGRYYDLNFAFNVADKLNAECIDKIK